MSVTGLVWPPSFSCCIHLPPISPWQTVEQEDLEKAISRLVGKVAKIVCEAVEVIDKAKVAQPMLSTIPSGGCGCEAGQHGRKTWECCCSSNIQRALPDRAAWGSLARRFQGMHTLCCPSVRLRSLPSLIISMLWGNIQAWPIYMEKGTPLMMGTSLSFVCRDSTCVGPEKLPASSPGRPAGEGGSRREAAAAAGRMPQARGSLHTCGLTPAHHQTPSHRNRQSALPVRTNVMWCV